MAELYDLPSGIEPGDKSVELISPCEAHDEFSYTCGLCRHNYVKAYRGKHHVYDDEKIQQLAARRAHPDKPEAFSDACLSCVAHYDHLEKIAMGRAKDWARLVADHYVRRGQVIPPAPTAAIDPRVMFTRLRLMVTELAEVADAEADEDLEKLADGLCDLLYVVVGTAVEHGLGPILDELFREVNRSNETKDVSRPVAPGQKYAPGVGKGAGYEPPRLAEIINRRVNKG